MSESIVVGTDGSGTAKRAVAEAVRLAKALGAEVHVVCAHDPMRGVAAAGASGFVVVPTEDDDEAIAATLADAQAAVSGDGVAVHTHAVRGTPRGRARIGRGADRGKPDRGRQPGYARRQARARQRSQLRLAQGALQRSDRVDRPEMSGPAAGARYGAA